MRVGIVVAAVAAVLMLAGTAQAASVAYVDGGAIWVAKLDGSRKVMLADATSAPVDSGPFREVTASDSGRILGVRRPDNRGGQYGWMQVWEPDGSSTKQGPLGKTGSWSIYAYPTSIDISGDGAMIVYGHSNSTLCCPIFFSWGTYATSVNSASVGQQPIDIPDQRSPSLFGRRIVSTQNDNITYTQNDSSGAPFNNEFTQWSTEFTGAKANGYEMGRTDVAANGALAAGEFVKWDQGSSARLDGGVFVYSIAGFGGALTGTLGCDLPAQGIASDVSISQDATMIAWHDDGGVKVAGAPTGQVGQPDGSSLCTLGTAPVVISPTGTMPSIGGADVDVLRPLAPPPSGGGSTPGTDSTVPPPAGSAPAELGSSAAPVLGALPRPSTKTLAKGITITLRVRAAGKLAVVATVPAKKLGKRGKPIVVATGRATATGPGSVKVKLRLNAVGRKNLKKLKGTRLTFLVNGKPLPKTVRVARAAKKKKKPPARCPAGKTPSVAKRGGKAVLVRDKRGRVRCTAVKPAAVPAPAQSPNAQIGQVADVLESAAAMNPKAFAKVKKAIGARRTTKLLDAGLVGWRQAVSAARAHKSDTETKGFAYGGADGSASFSLDKVEGEQSGFRAAASAEMKVARADLEKLSPDLKDKLPADVTGARAKIGVSFEDVAATCPDDKGAVPGKLHGNGQLTITVERSGGPPIEVKLTADVGTTYTAQVGVDGKVSAINGVDMQTTFQTGGSGNSTETYRGHITGSGFGREGLLDAPSGGGSVAIDRDFSHINPNVGGVFGPHGSWRYGSDFPISDLRTVDNIKAMAATNIATNLLTLAALEYLRKVTLDRIDKSACGFSVLVDLTSRTQSAYYTSSGKLNFQITAKSVPGSPGVWKGSAPAEFTDVSFTPRTECALHTIVSKPSTFTVDIKQLPSGNLEVSWSADPSASASLDCPPDNSDPPYDPPPVAGMLGPSLVGATPMTYELPSTGGSQTITGSIDAGAGDGIFPSGTLLVSRS